MSPQDPAWRERAVDEIVLKLADRLS